MKHLCFPASYARLSEEEQCETIGGDDLRSAWSTFTDNLHFGDFSMGSGLLTFSISCLLYTSDAADEEDSVDLGGIRILNKKKKKNREV